MFDKNMKNSICQSQVNMHKLRKKIVNANWNQNNAQMNPKQFT